MTGISTHEIGAETAAGAWLWASDSQLRRGTIASPTETVWVSTDGASQASGRLTAQPSNVSRVAARIDATLETHVDTHGCPPTHAGTDSHSSLFASGPAGLNSTESGLVAAQTTSP